VRVSQAWQGDQFGASHIPRIGQEVIVSFTHGDPDCPIITGRLPNRVDLPPWVLPGQHALSGFRSKELFGERHNTFVQDDTPGEIQTQLGSDHQASMLSLGYITRIPDADGRRDKRGEGFELRTDGWGALRGGSGLLLTAEIRPEAVSFTRTFQKPRSGSPTGRRCSRSWAKRPTIYVPRTASRLAWQTRSRRSTTP
jgi:type VI secretion system secreted protein VgrG